MNKRILAGYAVVPAALVLVPAAPYGPLYFVGLWARTPYGPYLALAVSGLLAIAAVVGALWSDRTPVRILRMCLLVLAFLALLAGTVIVVLAWLGVGMNPGLGGGYARVIGVIGFWPAGVLMAWLLGTMALFTLRRFAAAVAYTAAALATIAAVTIVVVDAVRLVPLLIFQGWIVAFFFLVVTGVGVYLAWRELFSVEFLLPNRPVRQRTGRVG